MLEPPTEEKKRGLDKSALPGPGNDDDEVINEVAETPRDDEEESPMPVVISDETAQPLRALDRVDAHRRAPNLAGIVAMVLIVVKVVFKKIVRSTHLCLHTPHISGRNSFFETVDRVKCQNSHVSGH